jgi:hypothetical protein
MLEFEPEIADAYEMSVELRLVSDLADKLGATVGAHRLHALESSCKAIAQPASHDDSDSRRGGGAPALFDSSAEATTTIVAAIPRASVTAASAAPERA